MITVLDSVSTEGRKKNMHQSVGCEDAKQTQIDSRKEKLNELTHTQPTSKRFCKC